MGLQALGISAGGRIPEGVVAIEAAVAIDQQHQGIARLRRACRENRSLGNTQHCNGKRRVGAMAICMATHHRNRKFVTGETHPLQKRGGRLFPHAPDAVDQSQWPASHGGDVAEVHQHSTPAREPGVFIHQIRVHPFTGQQQTTALCRQQGCVVAKQGSDTKLRKGLVGEDSCRCLDVAFRLQTTEGPELVCQNVVLDSAHATCMLQGRRSPEGR